MSFVDLPNCSWRAVTESETEKKSIASHVHATHPQNICNHWVAVRDANTVSSERLLIERSLLGRRLEMKNGSAIVSELSFLYAYAKRRGRRRPRTRRGSGWDGREGNDGSRAENVMIRTL